MKTVINIVLAACVIGLIYVCYGSIMGPIYRFDIHGDRSTSMTLKRLERNKLLHA